MAKEKYIVVFTCRFAAGTKKFRPFETAYAGRGVRLVRMPCGASMHTGLILTTLEEGAEGVLLMTCPEGQCHYGEGRAWATRVVNKSTALLRHLGYPEESVDHVEGKFGEGASDVILDFASRLGVRVGPKLSFPTTNHGSTTERTTS